MGKFFKATSRTKAINHIIREMGVALTGQDHFVVVWCVNESAYSYSFQKLTNGEWIVEQIRERSVAN